MVALCWKGAVQNKRALDCRLPCSAAAPCARNASLARQDATRRRRTHTRLLHWRTPDSLLPTYAWAWYMEMAAYRIGGHTGGYYRVPTGHSSYTPCASRTDIAPGRQRADRRLAPCFLPRGDACADNAPPAYLIRLARLIMLPAERIFSLYARCPPGIRAALGVRHACALIRPAQRASTYLPYLSPANATAARAPSARALTGARMPALAGAHA